MIKVTDGVAAPATIAQFKAENPGLLVRRPIPDDVLNAHGYFNEIITAPGEGEVADGYELVGGRWQTKWRQLTESEQADALQAWRETAVVDMNQARKALHAAGLLSAVPAALASLPEADRVPAEIDWEHSTTVRRMSPLVIGLAPALGLPDEQVDDLFRAAAAL